MPTDPCEIKTKFFKPIGDKTPKLLRLLETEVIDLQFKMATTSENYVLSSSSGIFLKWFLAKIANIGFFVNPTNLSREPPSSEL